jgi:asparagine synthase (glutamine-hydrolysing)
MIESGETKPRFEVVSIPKTADMDDSSYVEAVERKIGLAAIKLAPSDRDLETLLAQSRHYQDLPDYPNQGIADYDSLLGSRGDFRVRLSGVGGDEWLTGSDSSYADDLRGLHFINILKRLRDQPIRNLLTDGLSPVLPRPVRRLARKIMRPELPHAGLTADFARRIHLADRMRLEQAGPRFPSYAQQDVYRMFTTGLRTYPYEMTERWGCARALEGRYPFLDRRIFEFALAIPEDQRTRGRLTRFVVRTAMRGILPEEVRTRTDKSTYGCAFITSLQKVGGARIFDDMKTVELGWFDAGWLQHQYEETLRLYHAHDFAYQYRVFHLWKAFAIELWYNAVFASAIRKQGRLGFVVDSQKNPK